MKQAGYAARMADMRRVCSSIGDTSVDGSAVAKYFLKGRVYKSVFWIHVAQNRGQ
jgi:hypothetical protein